MEDEEGKRQVKEKRQARGKKGRDRLRQGPSKRDEDRKGEIRSDRNDFVFIIE